MTKGKYVRTEKTREKIRQSRIGKFKNESNPNWRGNNITKIGLPKRVRATREYKNKWRRSKRL